MGDLFDGDKPRKQKSGGKIINTASMLSFQGGIFVPSYTASKSAVMGLTSLMANELATHNINVNASAPGYMATDNTEIKISTVIFEGKGSNIFSNLNDKNMLMFKVIHSF